MTAKMRSSRSVWLWLGLSAGVGWLLWQRRPQLQRRAFEIRSPVPPPLSPEAAARQAVRVARSVGAVDPAAAAQVLQPQAHGRWNHRIWLSLMLEAARAWSDRRAASKGAALALYTLFSLAPMLLLVVALAGVFFGEQAVSGALLQQVQSLVGPEGATAVATLLDNAGERSDGFLAGAISLGLLLVGATTAFAELKDSLDELWNVPPREGGGLWQMLRERFLSFGLILVLVLMLMASLVVSTVLAALGDVLTPLAQPGAVQLLVQGVTSVVSFFIVGALFAMIYKYLPETPIAWRDVGVGAFMTAVLFTVGKVAIGLYLGNGGVSSAYGAAGSVVVLITWIYYSAQIFFYGALLTHAYATRVGSHARQTPS